MTDYETFRKYFESFERARGAKIRIVHSRTSVARNRWSLQSARMEILVPETARWRKLKVCEVGRMETFRPCSGKGETNAPCRGDLEPVTVVRRAVGTRAFTTRILYVNFACRLPRLFTATQCRFIFAVAYRLFQLSLMGFVCCSFVLWNVFFGDLYKFH